MAQGNGSLKFSKSEAYVSEYPGVGFGLTLILGCRNPFNPPGFDQYKRKRLRTMRRRDNLADITGRIETYADFFQSFGYVCPLPNHLKRTVHSGFPRYNLMVDAHFMAEMCAGILVAVADYDRIVGGLNLDLASEGEACRGMGQREIKMKQGEIVLRDEKEIICVLCQGADEKTRVSENTRNVLFYAYAVPGIEKRWLEEGLTVAAETMTEFGGGTAQGMEIF
jgi:DNA/RNA-binding domain of Phe-tRNA-synthetase-like protein